MKTEDFDYLLNEVAFRSLPMRNTRPCDGISPIEKVSMVLEYVMLNIRNEYLIISSLCNRSDILHPDYPKTCRIHMGNIISDVCNAICDEMSAECFNQQNNSMWIDTANRFDNLWNFPNSLGAIDGKHLGTDTKSLIALMLCMDYVSSLPFLLSFFGTFGKKHYTEITR